MSGSPTSIGLDSHVLTQGSCFSDAMGNRLSENKIKALVNPFGVIYNPVSIHRALSYAIFNEAPPEHTYTQSGDVHVNFDVHSRFGSLDRKQLREQLNESVAIAHYFLNDADWLIITYGTAWVYTRVDTGEVVANCHKLPSGQFEKSLLSVSEIVASFSDFYNQLRRFNPSIRLMLTVSPVRHIRDTLEGNSVSKAVLRVACDELVRLFDDVDYFPAFEIMMDDLRDYRFYADDMLHPTRQAENYIWNKFAERYFSEEMRDFLNKWSPIRAALHHRPYHPKSPAHRQFLHETLRKLEVLKQQVDVSEEVNHIMQQLKS